MSIYDDLNKQKLARKRATKWLKELFVKQNANSISTTFSAIMKSVDQPRPDRIAFDAACKTAEMTPEETNWLWKYLKNCNAANWRDGNIRDVTLPAAQSGW